MEYASIGPIAIHLPETVEDNDRLKAEYPKWDMELIAQKTGIRARHIAAADQCASDLGVAAAEKLFRQHNIDRQTIDFLLFCTQTARLSPAHHRLPRPRSPWPAYLGRRPGFQSRLFGVRVWAVAGRRPDPQRGGPPRPLDHRRDLLEVHPSQRSLAADDLRRRRGGDAGRGRRRAFAWLIRLRHRWPRGRRPDGHRRRRPAAAAACSNPANASAGPAASSWMARSWSSSRWRSCRR